MASYVLTSHIMESLQELKESVSHVPTDAWAARFRKPCLTLKFLLPNTLLETPRNHMHHVYFKILRTSWSFFWGGAENSKQLWNLFRAKIRNNKNSRLVLSSQAAYLSFWKVEIPQLLKLSANSLAKAKFPSSWQQAEHVWQIWRGRVSNWDVQTCLSLKVMSPQIGSELDITHHYSLQ